MRDIDIITLSIVALIILFTIMVFINTLKKNMTFEDAVRAALDPRPQKVLKPQKPQDTISEDVSCIIETTPAYTFDGKEVDSPRNVKCSKCHEYVYKDTTDKKCSPYKYRSDKFCIIDTKTKENCPF